MTRKSLNSAATNYTLTSECKIESQSTLLPLLRVVPSDFLSFPHVQVTVTLSLRTKAQSGHEPPRIMYIGAQCNARLIVSGKLTNFASILSSQLSEVPVSDRPVLSSRIFRRLNFSVRTERLSRWPLSSFIARIVPNRRRTPKVRESFI